MVWIADTYNIFALNLRKAWGIFMLEILKSILFGIVEGITEWLPISSTGHMILLDEFVKLDASDAFMEMYLVVIQLGAIMAVVLLFWNQLWPFCLPQNNKRFT